MHALRFILITLFLMPTVSWATTVKWPSITSNIAKDPAIEKRIVEILNKMSLAEKVGQMVQAEIKHATPEDVEKYHLGSVLNGGGSFPNGNKKATAKEWVALANSYYLASISSANGRTAIPIIWGTDAVHGHNNVFGATVFPHNIGLGAMRNPPLVKQIASATALEVLATGLDWIFAPTVAVVRNDRWGRTYEGFSEEPSIVRSYAGPLIRGIQGAGKSTFSDDHLVSTVKHFIGDGGTTDGVDQGDNTASEQELLDIHAQGYITAIKAGAQTIMASFNSWNGSKVHGSRYLLTEVLKNQMGFDGFVVGDWNGHGQVKGCSNASCPQAINAGIDMFMVPQDWKAIINNTIGQVKAGEISMERINDAVTRILRVKLRARLFERGAPLTRKHAADAKLIGSTKHREIARQAVRESLVLLKNNNKTLPLTPQKKVLVTGSGAHNIGRQSGGWTLTWQGTGNTNDDFPGATSIFDGINNAVVSAGGSTELSYNGDYGQRPDVAIVVFGEIPYAEGQGDITNLLYNWKYPEDLKLLKKLKANGIPVVSVFLTGRPLWMNTEINQSDAFVVAWLPGSEGAGIADVLFTKADGSINYDFSGKLSFSWPKFADQAVLNIGDQTYQPLFSYGYGLTYQDSQNLGRLSEVAFPGGNIPTPKDRVKVFKGRTIAPYINYVGDFANWNFPLSGDVGTSVGGLVNVKAIDKDIQEDARQISFIGGDSNYYFQANSFINIDSFVTNGILKLDIRIDQRPNHEAYILMGKGKMNFNHYLNVAEIKKWKNIGIPLKCFANKGTDFTKLNMPLSFATFGSMQISVANIEILATKPSKNIELITCN
jgi:beta-glucosidase